MPNKINIPATCENGTNNRINGDRGNAQKMGTVSVRQIAPMSGEEVDETYHIARVRLIFIMSWL